VFAASTFPLSYVWIDGDGRVAVAMQASADARPTLDYVTLEALPSAVRHAQAQTHEHLVTVRAGPHVKYRDFMAVLKRLERFRFHFGVIDAGEVELLSPSSLGTP
jgi:biopolymer transport protein ExbD